MSGIYIHIPFCKSKCPYCDFYSVCTNDSLKTRYVNALIDEIKTKKAFDGIYDFSTFKPDTLYLGGGTPSSLPPEALFNIITEAKKAFNLPKDAEITVECNPNSNLEELIPHLKAAGVNRISLGVQSAVDNERKKLGRSANRDRVLEVVKLLKANGITNISLDLMLGIPNQTKDSLKESLDFLLECDVPHISTYILNIEKNTPFYKMQDKLNLPDEDLVCDLFEFTSSYLKENGFIHYEISNFCKEGFHSRHNTKYWLLEEYLGLGPSAHSFLGGKRYYFESDIESFINGKKPIFDCNGGDSEEYIMLRLRLKSGLNLNELKSLYGESEVKRILSKLDMFINNGLINFNNETISLTEKGFLISNSIISELI